MFSSLRWRIGLALVLLTLVSVGLLGSYLLHYFSQSYLQGLKVQLTNEAWLVSQDAAQYLAGRDEAAVGELARRLGQGIKARVTIVREDGLVLGDSEQDPSNMANHADRPEIIDALAEGVGSSIRYSDTLGYDIFYVAVPVTIDGGAAGAARVSLPLTHVNQVLGDISRTVVFGAVLVVVGAFVTSRFVSGVTVGPVRRLSAMARRMTEGELEQELPVSTRDELGGLTRVFNVMAARIKNMIDTLSAERDRLENVLARMGDGILLVNGDCTVSIVNPAAVRMLGLPSPQVSGHSLVEMARDYELHDIVRRCLKSREQETGTVEILPSKTWLRVIATPLGNDRDCLVLLQDLSEMRRLQTMRRDFVSNVSHELRTPLASLKALAQTLQEGAIEDPEVSKDFLGRIDVEVDKLTQMVQELGDLSQIEGGRAPLIRTDFSVREVIEQAVARLSAQADRAGLTIGVDVSEAPPSVFADRNRVEQALVNLIHNAIKFTPPGGAITVSAAKRGDSAQISVTDTGIGIASEDLPRIFERFYKADKARRGGGTGLGLAIARHIVEAHGGSIWPESTEGKGSTFYFTLPVTSTS